MKIAILISSFAFGGAEKQVVEDANLLCTSNEVFVIAFSGGPLSAQLDKRIRFVVIPRNGYISTILQISRFIRSNNIDIVHSHLYAPMVVSAFACLLTNISAIWNFHSHAYENKSFAKKLHSFSSQLRSVKYILFPATELQDYYQLESYNFPSKKCLIAYNSGQPAAIKNTRQASADGKVHLGYIGRVIGLKRLHLLIELAEYLTEKGESNFRIDIVGDGPEKSQLEELCHSKGLDDKVCFHGFQEKTIEYYRFFDIFTFPSGEEVLSLSLIDAGLLGIPSVAFNVGGNHEILTDGSGGFVVNTKEDFFCRCHELLVNAEQRDAMGMEARKECLGKFSPEARLNYLIKLYESSLQKR